MYDNIAFIIIIIVCVSIFLYQTFKPSIDIVIEDNQRKILLWYNSFEEPTIERKYKILITFRL